MHNMKVRGRKGDLYRRAGGSCIMHNMKVRGEGGRSWIYICNFLQLFFDKYNFFIGRLQSCQPGGPSGGGGWSRAAPRHQLAPEKGNRRRLRRRSEHAGGGSPTHRGRPLLPDRPGPVNADGPSQWPVPAAAQRPGQAGSLDDVTGWPVPRDVSPGFPDCHVCDLEQLPCCLVLFYIHTHIDHARRRRRLDLAVHRQRVSS